MELHYAPVRIVGVLSGPFLEHRGLVPGPPPAHALTHDAIIAELARAGYVRLNAERPDPPPGARQQRRRVVMLVLGPDSDQAQKLADLRKLITSVDEPESRAQDLDELIVVADEPFFEHSQLVEFMESRPQAARAAADDGVFYTLCPYFNFTFVVPDHVSVPPHRVLPADEAAALLRAERVTAADIPLIYSCDPPVVWAGGRHGHIVEVVRDSATAGEAVVWRRVLHGVYSVKSARSAGKGAGSLLSEE